MFQRETRGEENRSIICVDGKTDGSQNHRSVVEQAIETREGGMEKHDISEKSISKSKHDDDKINVGSSKLISSITHILGGMLKDFSKDEDILKLGVGLGISLGAQGVLNVEKENYSELQDEELKHSNETISIISDPDSAEQEGDLQSCIFPTIVDESFPNEKEDEFNLSCKQETRQPIKNERQFQLPLQKSYITPKANKLGILPDHDKKSNTSTLKTISEPVSRGFLNNIKSRRVGKQHVHYISSTLNLPQCKPVGRVKPRSAGKDWLAIGFDPWSTGKELLLTEFVPFLVGSEDENNLIPLSAPNNTISFVKREDKEEIGFTKTKFKQLCSSIRHGNYIEFQQMLDDCDGFFPIDYTDDVGNTLLMVSCQNGNKRMVKLCLRKGSDINKQNTNGHTCLHYAFGYGFDELGAYLISKGADDNITNADGLTCYEGLRIEDIAAL